METTLFNGVCRCCASEGTFKNMQSSYLWMGDEEVYGDMLKDCFDITLSQSNDGRDSGICEVCITQLRNAANFKKQVLQTEEQIKKRAHTIFYKPNVVKLEEPSLEQEDDLDLSADEAFSGTDMDLPIKMETEEVTSKPKKRLSSARGSSSSKPKKSKIKTDKEISKKVKQKTNCSITLIAKEPSYIPKRRHVLILNREKPNTEIKLTKKANPFRKHIENLSTILDNSNTTLIQKFSGIGYRCIFCEIECVEPADLKKHNLESHQTGMDYEFLFRRKVGNALKIDMTDLKCNLCRKPFENLEKIISHLTKKHGKIYNKDVSINLVPFKFDSELFHCVKCEREFASFKILLQHMNIHYENYVCDCCGKGFISKGLLQSHMARHKTGVFKCNTCDKKFKTKLNRQAHERAVHVFKSKRSKCGFCGAMFRDYTNKNDHVVKMHGGKRLVLNCAMCEKTFDNQRALNFHMKKKHMDETRLTTD